MTDSSSTDHALGTRAFILLPFALGLHIAEEWFFGFPDWARFTLDFNIEPSQFLAINLVGFVLFTLGATVAYREPRAGWIGVSLAALFCLNAILHVALTVVVGVYSPGAITGLLLYVPLSIAIFRWAATNLSHAVIGGAILFGIGIHAAATLTAAL